MIEKNMKLLIDALEAGNLRYKNEGVAFHMGYYLCRIIELGSGWEVSERNDIRNKIVSQADIMQEDCGTIACIAGHAKILAENDPEFIKKLKEEYADDWEYCLSDTVFIARWWLDISYVEADALFNPKGEVLSGVTRQRAIETCKRFLRTGEVIWRDKE